LRFAGAQLGGVYGTVSPVAPSPKEAEGGEPRSLVRSGVGTDRSTIQVAVAPEIAPIAASIPVCCKLPQQAHLVALQQQAHLAALQQQAPGPAAWSRCEWTPRVW